jgi:hypothetical protein
MTKSFDFISYFDIKIYPSEVYSSALSLYFAGTYLALNVYKINSLTGDTKVKVKSYLLYSLNLNFN